MRMVPVRSVHAASLAAGLVLSAATQQLLAQLSDPSAAPPPRGQVLADCYARIEIWQGEVRTPLRLLHTRVAYDETTSGGVRRALASEWNKFVLPLMSAQGQLPGQSTIVYCQYADAAANTELARWPSSSPPAELVDWPGRTVSAAYAASMGAPGPTPQQPPAMAQPVVTPVPAAAASAGVPPASPPAGPSAPGAVGTPAQAAAPLAEAQDEAVQVQQATAVYDETKLRVEQHNREQQARDNAYRQQVEAFQQQLAASQAAQRAFEEQQRKYQQEKAAYDAQVSGQKDK